MYGLTLFRRGVENLAQILDIANFFLTVEPSSLLVVTSLGIQGRSLFLFGFIRTRQSSRLKKYTINL